MNRIPRSCTHILAQALTETNAGAPGDVFSITRDGNGLHGQNTRTGKWFFIFYSHIRNENYYKILSIV